MDKRPAEHFDKGLQQERTALAWERTAFSMVAVGALLMRAVPEPREHVGLVLLASLPFMMSTLVLISGVVRYERLHWKLRDNVDIRTKWLFAATAATTCVAALIAIATVLADVTL